jgi:uncharacterized protein (TIGR03435 family)
MLLGQAAFAMVVFCLCAQAQGPAFEVASVKRAATGTGKQVAACHGGPGTADPTRLTCTNVPLAMLICAAWDKQFYEVIGPDWTREMALGYDVAANIPANTNKDDYRAMLEKLLTERFRMTVHRETKEARVYSLAVASGGPKLKLNTGGPRSISAKYVDGHFHVVAVKQPMKNFSGFLTVSVQGPVTDDTALTGEYDFVFDYRPDSSGPPPADVESVPDLFGALPSQLGLALKAKKGQIEMLVVDRAEQTPVEN